MDADVVVIGAGLAGLAAARHVQQQGWSVLVLEATDRVGGRVRDAALPDGGAVELGAQWVGRDHAAVHALADELGVRLVAGEEVGQHLHVDADGQVQRYTGHLPPLPECAVEHLVTAFGDDAARPSGYVEQDWAAHPFVRGGYGALPLPGQDRPRSALLDGLPDERHVAFATADLGVPHAGYMDGALAAGVAAAERVIRIGSRDVIAS